MASNTTVSDPTSARQLGNASWGVSIAGIVLSILTIIIVAAVLASAASAATSTEPNDTLSSCHPYYSVGGSCYKYRRYIGSSSYYVCPGRVSGSYCYYNNSY